MREIWKDIPEYEGLYQVSNLGRVKSLPKEWTAGNGVVNSHNGKILKQSNGGTSYLKVNLYKCSIRKTIQVHKLVAIAFLSHVPNGHTLVVDHINDNTLDNRLENLQIVTHRYNIYKTRGKYSSKYKGVSQHPFKGKWVARIVVDGKLKHLGFFDCELKAHYAYQQALKELV